MDINKKIAENTGLIYQQLRRFKLSNDQDAESFAYEALYRAILTYDESTGNNFSTYAVCVIANELRKHLRVLNKKRQLTVVSYDEPLSNKENSSSVLDTLPSSETAEDYVLRLELQGVASAAIHEILETLTDTQRNIITMWYESDCMVQQREIAEALNVSQPTVSKAISAFKYKLKLRMEEYM